jgi:hypothetical protein
MATLISGSTGVDKIQDGTIVNADIASGAAIAGSKLVMPAGSVLQVVIAEDTSAFGLSSNTYTDTSLSAAITPSSTSSKVMAMWSVHARTTSAASGFGTRLVRGSTNVWTSANDYQQYFAVAAENHTATHQVYIDSPSTTSATTYKVQIASHNSVAIQVNSNGAQTQLVLMEIAG